MDDIWEAIFQITECIAAATCAIIVHPDALEDIVCAYTMDDKPYLAGPVEIAGVPVFAPEHAANSQKALLVNNTGETLMIDWPCEG